VRSRRAWRRGPAAARATLLAIATSTIVPGAQALPQVTAGVTTGAAITDLRAENRPRLAYHLGGRLDALLLRARPTDMAVGPFAEVLTAGFDTAELGGGLAWLVPTGSTALVLSAGGFGRASRFGWEPGVSSTLFWGSRSYNFHSAYALGVGLFAQGRYGLGDGRQADALLGVQLDLEYFALPFVLAYQALAH
jgi:hypothetical protein